MSPRSWASDSIWTMPNSLKRWCAASIHHHSGRQGRRDRRQVLQIHLPGHTENEPGRPFQHLEKRNFERGNFVFRLSWPLWRRRNAPLAWYCAMPALAGNLPRYRSARRGNNLCRVQHAGAHQNGMWVVGVAKAGIEQSGALLGQGGIVAPMGEIVAMYSTDGDELVTALCGLDRCSEIRDNVFNLNQHREPDTYKLICQIRPASDTVKAGFSNHHARRGVKKTWFSWPLLRLNLVFSPF